MSNNTQQLDSLLETERVRNRFINHEFKKLDRTQSRINAPEKSSSDTESESDSEFFLKKKPIQQHNHHHHHNRQTGKKDNSNSNSNSNVTTATVPAPLKTKSTVANNNSSSVTTSPISTSGVSSSPSSSSSSSSSSTPSSSPINASPNVTSVKGNTIHPTSISPLTTLSTSDLNLFASRPSLLSSESTGVTYKGLLNLVVIMLSLMSFRLVILNHLAYGFRIDFGLLAVSEWHRWPGVLIALSINFYILAAFLIEKAASIDLLPTRFLYLLRVINCFLIVTAPSASVLTFKPNPASGIIVMILVCVFSMKIISYSYENSKQKNLTKTRSSINNNGTKDKEKTKLDPTIYPNNLTLKSTYWFMLVPTLVYQLQYPRSDRIRKAFLLRRIVEALFLSALIFYMVEQYMVPLVENSLVPLEQDNYVLIVERVLKLSLPNLSVWLLGFYVFFHLYLNICAEITRFGDREFYRDWWNSTGLDYFWRTWNMPVHHWMVVLIYTPMRRRGLSKNMGYFMCFFVSAIFHELVISVPFQTFKLWAFFGIMSQMVLIALTKNQLNGQNVGNVIFWLSLVIGQPYIVLQYYKSFIQEHPHLYPTTIMEIHDLTS
ncbi:diacylglycerol O-acyltransferase 1 [Cavenderia fasciculata]|uniref:O-acyltransferase n=1 Tax=Cavenderia fasciculata TaxID=261658 RepID=F4Q276_CACFS|nr:diacylglycerol O-acyltransferase 1 [Cavenderia fasciculata]EGG18096.1 diacylglycerol O-acyltransferase 1 [Cavenderia fasciculata]|eukprot:XP_004366137.1 diacylglycerol O-acyltransferase 1 [Cavenderia fasciculata]